MASSTTTSPPSYLLLLIIFLFVSLALLGKTNVLDMSNIISYVVKTEANYLQLLSQDNDQRIIFELWLEKQNKTYRPLEKEKRFEIFKDNWRYIKEHNALPNRSYDLGLNRFADLTNDEYQSTYLETKMYGLELQLARYEQKEGDDNNLPAFKDWEAEGAVGPIRDQGKCKSSWAFSAIASVEAVNKIVTGGDLISLSAQELVDCDRRLNFGCRGGFVPFAFTFMRNYGINNDSNYPYTGPEGTCDPSKVTGERKYSYEYRSLTNEKALKEAVANQPVSAQIDAGGRDFQLYESGVFNGGCDPGLIYHVNVVGYNYDYSHDTEYWIIRSSLGTGWGEEGYLRLKKDHFRSKYGICSIASSYSYPIKVKPDEAVAPFVVEDTRR